MDLLYQLFGDAIAVVTIVSFVKFVVWFMFVVFGLRFLIRSIDYLQDIAVSLRLLCKRNKFFRVDGKTPYILQEMLENDDVDNS